MKNNKRRPLAIISKSGVTNLHRNSPYMMMWWSAAFPGFSHFLLNQYIRGTLLSLTEVAINTLGNVNEAIVYTFCGEFEMAKSVLQPRWAIGYIIIYLYTIWDSYRITLVQNKMCHIAELENERLDCMVIHPQEIQYLEKRNPFIGGIYSFLFPGLGQLYNHRFGLAFYGIVWWWIYNYMSGAHESLVLIITGNIRESIAILNPQWLLFMPSVLWGSAYHAFITSREHNRLFRLEQRQFLAERYKNSDVSIFT